MIVELILLGVIGLAVGSFLMVVTERIDTADSFLFGRSHCNHCKKDLSWWKLLPFVGYFLVRGQCLDCHARIPKIYPVFELLTGLIFVLLRFTAPQPVNYPILIFSLLFVCILLVLFFYDWLHQSFPVSVLWAGLGGVVVLNGAKLVLAPALVSRYVTGTPYFEWIGSPSWPWAALLLGGVVGVVLLGLLAFPSRGRWMGYGDVILIALLGLWIGYPFILVALLIAFYAGAIVGVGQLATKTARKDHHLAFGPFLILGAIITQAWGMPILSTIMKWWGAT